MHCILAKENSTDAFIHSNAKGKEIDPQQVVLGNPHIPVHRTHLQPLYKSLHEAPNTTKTNLTTRAIAIFCSKAHSNHENHFSLLPLPPLLPVGCNAAVSRGIVASKAAPCIAFVTCKQPKPAPACCSGLLQLAHGAVMVADHRAICRCTKSGVKAIPRVQDKFLGKAPASCGIKIGFPVSLNTNCNQIN